MKKGKKKKKRGMVKEVVGRKNFFVFKPFFLVGERETDLPGVILSLAGNWGR